MRLLWNSGYIKNCSFSSRFGSLNVFSLVQTDQAFTLTSTNAWRTPWKNVLVFLIFFWPPGPPCLTCFSFWSQMLPKWTQKCCRTKGFIGRRKQLDGPCYLCLEWFRLRMFYLRGYVQWSFFLKKIFENS